MDLKREAEKETARVKKVMELLEIVNPKKSESLVKVMKSYYEDCLSFYKKGQYLQALETSFILWAYVDAGLHLGVFKVPGELKRMFTV